MPVIRENSASRMEMDCSPCDVCRLCAESYESRSFIPLYTDGNRERIITKQINQLVVNLVSPDDGLPQKICLKCAKNVETCYSFVCHVIETQNKLKRLMRAAEDEKLKRQSDDQFVQNSRWENVALKDYDNGLITARRSISKSSVCPIPTKTIDDSQDYSNAIDIDCERSLTTPKNTRTLGTKLASAPAPSLAATNRARFSSTQSQPQSQLQREAVVADQKTSSPSCLYRCGVCLEKFLAKDECIRHMMCSHTPPPSVSSFSSSTKDARNVVSFDVVRKNGVAGGNYNTDTSNNKSEQRKCVSQTSSSLKSRKKVLAIDSFYQEIKKNCTRYKCDVCGRLMTSWFAFKRHLREHRETEASADSHTLKLSAVNVNAKPLIGYCKICNKLVKHFRRHKMYHTIVKLELDYPNFVKFLSV